LPSTVFLLLLGLPHRDLPLLLQWRDNTVRPDVAPDDWEGAAAIREQTGRDVNEYFTRANAERRDQPDGGVLRRVVHA
jgi:cytochrome P450